MLTLILVGITGYAGVSVPTAAYTQELPAIPVPGTGKAVLGSGVGELAVGGVVLLIAGALLLGFVRRKDRREPPPRDYDPDAPP